MPPLLRHASRATWKTLLGVPASPRAAWCLVQHAPEARVHLPEAGPPERAKLLLVPRHSGRVRVEAVRPRAVVAIPAGRGELARRRHISSTTRSRAARTAATATTTAAAAAAAAATSDAAAATSGAAAATSGAAGAGAAGAADALLRLVLLMH